MRTAAEDPLRVGVGVGIAGGILNAGGIPDFFLAKTTPQHAPQRGIFGVQCTPWVVLKRHTERIAATSRDWGGAGL